MLYSRISLLSPQTPSLFTIDMYPDFFYATDLFIKFFFLCSLCGHVGTGVITEGVCYEWDEVVRGHVV